ncbi:hemophore-related protein [Mycolicibacterium sphagni]|nr:hemophore-related protein [Mycolicibacterium sphagni]
MVTAQWGKRMAVVCASVVGMALAAVSAPAYAAPDLSPLVNTTCNYSQVVAALNAQAPDLAKELSQFPQAESRLQSFLAAPVNQRQQILQQASAAHPQWEAQLNQRVGTAQGQQYENTVIQVANTCNQY